MDERVDHATEDCSLLDDAQEAFRKGRSTKRLSQLAKHHSILDHQRKLKRGLSVILYLDIKNAFNVVNHRAMFSIMEACGFPEGAQPSPKSFITVINPIHQITKPK
jgi:hypothetical protein